MKQIVSKPAVYLWLALYSALATYLVIGTPFFPSTGLAISFILLATTIYALQERKTAFTTFAFIGTVTFSIFLILRANALVTFFNIVAIFFLGAVMIEQGRGMILGLVHAIFAPILVIAQSLATASSYNMTLSMQGVKEGYEKRKHTMPDVIKGLLITALLLLIIVPLLAYANPIFGNLVDDLLHFFTLPQWVYDFFKPITIVRLIVLLLLVFILPRLLTYANTEATAKEIVMKQRFGNLLIPKIAVIVVLGIFFVTQLQLYFADSATLAAIGYTNSKLTREVFGQLSVVIFVIFVLLYNDKQQDRMAKITTAILLIETFFLGGIAAKSVFDYIGAWGFTQKRLYGVTAVIWLAGMLVAFGIYYFKKLPASMFTKTAIVYTALVLLGINVANFDYLIYHNRKTTLPTGVDYNYLSGLSTDSYSYHSQLAQLMPEIQNQASPSSELLSAAGQLVYQVERLDRRQQKGDFRTFNYSAYRQAQQVDGIDTKQYRAVLDQKWPYAQYR